MYTIHANACIIHGYICSYIDFEFLGHARLDMVIYIWGHWGDHNNDGSEGVVVYIAHHVAAGGGHHHQVERQCHRNSIAFYK